MEQVDRRPIFAITHSRSCSTAFERIFMTRSDMLECHHEPFGDAFYFGPEKISPAWTRWPGDKIEKTGKSHYTYDLVLSSLQEAAKEPNEPPKRVFLKDIAYHVIPPSHSPNATASSLEHLRNSQDPQNPTLLPTPILHNFQFIFLIRKPSLSMPSLYRCFIPPLSEITKDYFLDPTEIGYRELRILFEYLCSSSSQLSTIPSPGFQAPDDAPILIDADDLLADPEAILQTICSRLNFPYSSSMLTWDTPEDHARAEAAFKKFAGYHEDALHSTGLKSRALDQGHQRREANTGDEQNQEWTQRFGDEGARTIREAVDICQDDYDFLYQFRIKPQKPTGHEVV